MARVHAWHLENVTSRNAFWRCYIVDDPSFRTFWISHWGGRTTRGNFKISFDGAVSFDMALTKRDEKTSWRHGYTQAAHHVFDIDADLAGALVVLEGGKRTDPALHRLAYEFTRVIAGGETLDEIFAGLRDMIAELSD